MRNVGEVMFVSMIVSLISFSRKTHNRGWYKSQGDFDQFQVIHRPHRLEKLLVTPFCLSSIVWAWLTFLDRVIRSGVGLISCKASYVANTGSKCRKRIKDGFITNNLCNTLFFFASASLFSVTTSLFLNLHLSSSLKRSTR